MRLVKTLAAVAATVAAVTAVAACGSGGSEDAAPVASSTDAVETAQADAGLVRARAGVERYSVQPTSIGVTEKLAEIPSGTHIEFLEPGVPVGDVMGDAIEEAGEALGLKVTRIDMGTTPEEITKAFDQAAADLPDAVLTTGVSPDLWERQLAVFRAHEIPVIAWAIPEDPSNGITANINDQNEHRNQGAAMADYVVAEENGKANAVFFWIPDFRFFKGMVDGFEAELEATCPECTFDVQEAKATDIGQALPGRVVSYLQRNPDTDWVVFAFGDMAIGVPAALAAAGLTDTARIMTQAGGVTNFQYIKDDQQEIDLGLPLGLLSWKAVDTAMRAITGQSLEADAQPLPIQYLTRDNLDFDISAPWNGVPDYREQFKQLWGL